MDKCLHRYTYTKLTILVSANQCLRYSCLIYQVDKFKVLEKSLIHVRSSANFSALSQKSCPQVNDLLTLMLGFGAIFEPNKPFALFFWDKHEGLKYVSHVCYVDKKVFNRNTSTVSFILTKTYWDITFSFLLAKKWQDIENLMG